MFGDQTVVPTVTADEWRNQLRTTIHHVSTEDTLILARTFAYLTPEGWRIPDWLALMMRTVRT